MVRRNKLKVKNKREGKVAAGSGSVRVQGYWATMLKEKFAGRKQLALIKSPHYKGYYKLYWLEDKFNIGVIGPDGAAWICPVSPIHFKEANVPRLIAEAQKGVFPIIRNKIENEVGSGGTVSTVTPDTKVLEQDFADYLKKLKKIVEHGKRTKRRRLN